PQYGKRGRTAQVVVAFKSGTDDLRSSPALAILRALESHGVHVHAYDPFVSPEVADRAGLNGSYRPTLQAAVEGTDAAILTTADPSFRNADWAGLSSTMKTPVIIDGRNALRHVTLPAHIRYFPIGQGGRLAN